MAIGSVEPTHGRTSFSRYVSFPPRPGDMPGDDSLQLAAACFSSLPVFGRLLTHGMSLISAKCECDTGDHTRQPHPHF